MARLTGWVLLIAAGAGGMYSYQYFVSKSAPMKAQRSAPREPLFSRPAPLSRAAAGKTGSLDPGPDFLAPGAHSPHVVEGPETSREPVDQGPVAGSPGGLPPEAPPPEAVAPHVLVLGADGAGRGAASRTVAAAPNPLLGAEREEIEESYRSATKAIAAGDVGPGFELYRLIYSAARERGDIDVSIVAHKLLEATTDEQEKLGYQRYLARSESSSDDRFEANLRVGEALARARGEKSLASAWDFLTRAYLTARDRDERRRVLDVLEPFLHKNIFSRRPSVLLVKYRVKNNEYLSGIAARHQTTVDAIKRLNGMKTGMKSDVIHPGQRLLILPGRASVFIKKYEFRLVVFISGRLLMEKPIGIGADDSTPAGTFAVAVRQKNPIWYRAGEAPLLAGDPRNILGTRWLGFANSDASDGIGIHGTPDETSIGKEISSGCIRMRNADIESVFDFIPRQTVITIED